MIHHYPEVLNCYLIEIFGLAWTLYLFGSPSEIIELH